MVTGCYGMRIAGYARQNDILLAWIMQGAIPMQFELARFLRHPTPVTFRHKFPTVRL